MTSNTLALTVHGYEWDLPDKRVALGSDATLVTMKKSPIGTAFREFDRAHPARDAGSVYYDFAAYIDPPRRNAAISNSRGPRERLDLLADVITLVGEYPQAGTRLLHSSDDFATIADFEVLPWAGHGHLCFGLPVPTLDRAGRATMVKLWARTEALVNSKAPTARVRRALGAFGRAWRAAEPEQIQAHLREMLRVLFAVPSKQDSALTIARRAENFLNDATVEPCVAQNAMQQVVGSRARCADPTPAAFNAWFKALTTAFQLACRIMRKVLIDREYADRFDDERTHRKLAMALSRD